MTAARVYVAWGQDPVGFNPGIAAWTEISGDLLDDPGVRIKRGASDEGASVETSECSFTLKNASGQYTPGFQGGANWPNVVRDLPVKVEHNGTVRFVGFVKSFSLDWPANTNSYGTCAVTASGVMARLAQSNELQTTIAEEILQLSPLWYYPMDDPQESGQLADLSGNNARAVTVPWALGQDTDTDLLGLERTSVPNVSGGPSTVGLPGVSRGLYAAASYTLLLRTKAPADITATLIDVLKIWQSGGWWQVLELDVTGAKTLYYSTDGSTSTGIATVFQDLADGLWHMVTVVVDSGGNATFYVDGAALATASSVTVPQLGRFVLAPYAVVPDTWGDLLRVAHFAGFDFELSAAQVLNLYRAASVSFAFDTVDQRIIRVAGYENQSVAVTLPSSVTLVPQEIVGVGALEAMRAAAVSDLGTLYETLDGNLAYIAGARRTTLGSSAAYLTLGSEVAQVQPTFDDQTLTNRATATSSYAVAASENAESIDRLGRYGMDVDSEAILGQYLQHLTQWLVNTRDETMEGRTDARPRVPSVSFYLHTDPTLLAAWQAGDPLVQRLTFTSPPPQMLGPVELIIEGYTETITTMTYTVTAVCSPLVPCWTVGDATLGRLHPKGHQLSADITADATSMQVTVPAGTPAWITTGPFPDLDVDGEFVSVSAIGALSGGKQTFTITRGVGGTTAKAHVAGTVVQLRSRHVVAL